MIINMGSNPGETMIDASCTLRVSHHIGFVERTGDESPELRAVFGCALVQTR